VACAGVISAMRGDGGLVVIDAHQDKFSANGANGTGAASRAAARAAEQVGYEEAFGQRGA